MKLPFNESFLHFLWQYQYFDHTNLRSYHGEVIEIIHTGYKNSDAGPDFLQAKIRINDIIWVGNIEIHKDAIDWSKHKHQFNEGYNNVILHVVYEQNENEFALRQDKTTIPILEIKSRISQQLLEKANKLAVNNRSIPCSDSIGFEDDLIIKSAVNRMAIERYERKANTAFELLEKNQFDWETTVFQLIAQNFGMKINNETFLKLAQSIPFKIVQKFKDNQFSLEALFLGSAGFLASEPKDVYQKLLKDEYQFISHKYGLKTMIQLHEWKYLRLRPFNFPEKRIAELAALYSSHNQFTSLLFEIETLEEFKQIIQNKVTIYWQNHYGFGKRANKKSMQMGKQAIDNLLINALVLIYFVKSIHLNDQIWMDKAISFLEKVPAENNRIIREWLKLNVTPTNAFDSQGLIELYNNYCTRKKCLDCQIGVSIIKK